MINYGNGRSDFPGKIGTRIGLPLTVIVDTASSWKADLIGLTLIFFFSSLAIRAVGVVARRMIEEVRRQFRVNPKIMLENPAERANNKLSFHLYLCSPMVHRVKHKTLVSPFLSFLSIWFHKALPDRQKSRASFSQDSVRRVLRPVSTL